MEYAHKRQKVEWEAEKKAQANEIECLTRGKRKLESEHMELIKQLDQLRAEKEELQKDLGKERVLSSQLNRGALPKLLGSNLSAY